MSHSRRLATLAAALLPLLMLPGTAEAQFGKNKIQYQEFDWKIYHSPHFDVYYYTAEEHLLERVVSFAESAYDELSRRFDYQIEQSDAAHLLQDPRRVRAEQHHPRFHPRGGRCLRHRRAVPHGAAGGHARLPAARAGAARADAHLPVPHPLRRQGLSHAGEPASHLAHRGDGQLLRAGRVDRRQDVPPRRGGQRPRAPDHAGAGWRVLRLPLRPRGVRLHGGEVGRRGGARLPPRVPQHARRQRRQGAHARLPRRGRGLRRRLPALAAREVPPGADQDR